MARIYDKGYQHTCDQCGKPMPTRFDPHWPDYKIPPRSDTKFCTNRCRQKAYRLRRRVARGNAAPKP